MSKKSVLLVCCLAGLSLSCAKIRAWFGLSEDEPAPVDEAQVAEDRTGTFVRRGVLALSEIFFGPSDAPNRYLLRDPETKAILAHVQTTRHVVDLSDHVGKYVKIAGEVYDDEVVGLVVEAQTVTVIGPAPPGAEEVEPPGAVKPEPAVQPEQPRDLTDL